MQLCSLHMLKYLKHKLEIMCGMKPKHEMALLSSVNSPYIVHVQHTCRVQKKPVFELGQALQVHVTLIW